MKAIRKSYVVEYITFEELEIFIKNTTIFPHDTSYYNGAGIIRDEDSFLILNDNHSKSFTRNDVLITNNNGFVFPLCKKIFLDTYHVINIDKTTPV